jgi:hypothetical protein
MLLDRDVEKQALDRLLATVREGLSASIVLRGEAGIGKSALLEYVTASAGDVQVTHVVAVESEMELGFAGLHQVLVPFLSGLERLPAPQREALGSAFGLIGGVAADLFLVGLAALTLLADAAGVASDQLDSPRGRVVEQSSGQGEQLPSAGEVL